MTIIAVVTGLSLGLKRIGKDNERSAVIKWKKLTPAEKASSIPWYKIQEASGKTIYEFGKYFPSILSASVSYAATKKKKRPFENY